MSLEKRKKITPSMFRPRVPYTITINPEDQYEEHPDRIERCIKRVKKKLDIMSLQYTLYAECSNPLTPTKHRFPRIHFHGIIHFENTLQISKWYNVDYFKMATIGYFEIDTLDDYTYWKKYCKKEQPIMSKICNISRISSLRPYTLPKKQATSHPLPKDN